MNLLVYVAILFSLVAMRTALAQEPERRDLRPLVVLVFRPGDAFGLRLAAELQSTGVQVLTLRRLPRVLPEGTVAVATVSGQRGVQVRSAGPHLPHRRPDWVLRADAANHDLQATQVAEGMRAMLEPLAGNPAAVSESTPDPLNALPLATVPVVPVRPVPAVPIAPAVAPPPPPRKTSPPGPQTEPDGFTLGLSVGVGAMTGSQGSSVLASTSAFIAPTPWFRIEPFVIVPVLPAKVEAPGGSADFYSGIAGARVGFRVWEIPTTSLQIGAGLAGVWLRAVGEPTKGFVGMTVNGFSAAAMIDVAPHFHLYGPLWLVPRATLGVGLPPIVILFDRELVARWGAPFGALSIATEFKLLP